jgi:hypothetical protein
MMPFEKSSKCSVIDRYRDDERDDAGDDLVVGRAGDEQAKRQERAAHEQQPEIAGDERPPFGAAVDEENRDVEQGDQEHRDVEPERPEELAENDLEIRDRRGEEQFDRSRPLLFRVGPHRDHRHDEQDDHRRVLQHVADDLLVHVHRPAHFGHLHALADECIQIQIEEDAEGQREEPDDDVGHRRREVRAQLLMRNREHVTHWRLPPCSRRLPLRARSGARSAAVLPAIPPS